MHQAPKARLAAFGIKNLPARPKPDRLLSSVPCSRQNGEIRSSSVPIGVHRRFSFFVSLILNNCCRPSTPLTAPHRFGDIEAMKSIQSTEEFQQLTQGEKYFCAVFSAEWCPDCRVIKAVLPGLEEEYGERFDFAVVDRDQFAGIAEEYQVLGIPSFIVFRSGRVVDTFISTLRKTRMEITRFLDKAVSHGPE